MQLKAGILLAVLLGIIIIISVLLFGIVNYLPLKTERLSVGSGNAIITQYAGDWTELRQSVVKPTILDTGNYPMQLFGDTLVIYNTRIIVKYDTVTYQGKENYHE